jgi:Resolvase, N terminal domain
LCAKACAGNGAAGRRRPTLLSRNPNPDRDPSGGNDPESATGGFDVRVDAHEKGNAGHLKRNAYLYVRQSTIRQVFENTESTKRQYALRQHAVALGWPVEQIVVIDTDLGQSGASAVDREGFQRLVTEVSLGKAGIVLGLEVSRLDGARQAF